MKRVKLIGSGAKSLVSKIKDDAIQLVEVIMGNALTQKILITLGFLFAYRVLAYIPVPGVDLM